MSKLIKLGLLCLISIMLTSFVSAAEREISAQESVDIYIDALFKRVLEVKPLYNSDRDQFFLEVELALSDFVDFNEVARGVMAKYGTGPNGANAEQMERFANVFKNSLVDFYGSALASYNGEEYQFKESRREPRNPESATSVIMSVGNSVSDSIEVQYIMFLNDDRVWKLKNLYVEGINLRRQYYSQFDNLMTRNNYDIDKVIELWSNED